eukprot:scaffold4.g4675.t1
MPPVTVQRVNSFVEVPARPPPKHGRLLGLWSRCSGGDFYHKTWGELRKHPFRDSHYNEQMWDTHASWRRYIPELPIILLVIVSLSPVWLWSVFVSAMIGVYEKFAVGAGAPSLDEAPSLIMPFTLTSFALSLLLLYKTNSAYGRWWEARIQLGTLYIVSRSIVRLSITWVGRRDPHLVPAIQRWTAAIMPSLCAFLRGSHGMRYYDHLNVVSSILLRADIHDFERVQIEELLNTCDVCTGACERILRTAMPLAHTHRFLLVYITTLPFALWSTFHWATLPVMAVLSFLLLGVENIGIQIEEPFRVLPLDGISAGTVRAVATMLSDRDEVSGMAGYSMALAAAQAAAHAGGEGAGAAPASCWAASDDAGSAAEADEEEGGAQRRTHSVSWGPGTRTCSRERGAGPNGVAEHAAGAAASGPDAWEPADPGAPAAGGSGEVRLRLDSARDQLDFHRR